jgi:hypothetical protein
MFEDMQYEKSTIASSLFIFNYSFDWIYRGFAETRKISPVGKMIKYVEESAIRWMNIFLSSRL